MKKKGEVRPSKQDEIQKRWKEHFLEVLNRPAPEDNLEFDDEAGIPEPEIDVDALRKAENYAALKEKENGTAGGVDSLTVEMLKAELETSSQARNSTTRSTDGSLPPSTQVER